MKKLILILLFFTGVLQAQTLQNPTFGNTTTNTLKIKNPAMVTSVNFLSTVEIDGSINKINPELLPLSTATINAINTNSFNYKASKGLVSGDSTIAEYLGQTAVSVLLVPNSDLSLGSTVTSIAVPGHTISQQKSAYLALTDKDTYDYVIVQIGLNDIGYTESNAVIISRLQDYINTINSYKKTTCKIIIGAMIPCRQRFIDLYGETNGQITQSQWEALNESIIGNGSTPITGVERRVYEHVGALRDRLGNLAYIYDVGDHIHETTSAREIIANAHKKSINQLGYLTSTPAKSINKYSFRGVEVDGILHTRSSAEYLYGYMQQNRNDTQRYGFVIDLNAVDDGGFGIVDVNRNQFVITFDKNTGRPKIPYFAGSEGVVTSDLSGNLGVSAAYAKINNPSFTGIVQVPNGNLANEAVNKGQLDAVSSLDANNVKLTGAGTQTITKQTVFSSGSSGVATIGVTTSGSANGISVQNNGYGLGGITNNVSSGVGYVYNSQTGSTGDLLQFSKNNITTAVIDQNGNYKKAGGTANQTLQADGSVLVLRDRVITSSTSTITLPTTARVMYYVYKGTGNVTWNLPLLASSSDIRFVIINKSATGTITLPSGTNQIWDSGTTSSSTTCGPGASMEIYNDSENFVIL